MDVLDLYNVLNNLDVELEAIKAMTSTSDEIVHANKEQLLQGTKADGTTMPNYSPVSVSIYGKPDGPIRLFDTGAFQESFKVEVDSDGFNIKANDIHELEDRYTSEIYGLDPLSQEYYNTEIFAPIFISNIQQQTGLI